MQVRVRRHIFVKDDATPGDQRAFRKLAELALADWSGTADQAGRRLILLTAGPSSHALPLREADAQLAGFETLFRVRMEPTGPDAFFVCRAEGSDLMIYLLHLQRLPWLSRGDAWTQAGLQEALIRLSDLLKSLK